MARRRFRPRLFEGENRNIPIIEAYYRKRGSASYIVREVLSVRERERDTEIDGSDVTIVALKLAMNLHFPLPKNRTIGDALSLFLAKIRTFRFSLHVTIVALKFAMSSHFPLPKKFSPSLFPLFQMARAARRVVENPRQMIKSCPLLFCSSHRKYESNEYQKLLEIEKEIAREVALCDKPYLRKSTDRKAQIRKVFVQFSGLICPLRSVDFFR